LPEIKYSLNKFAAELSLAGGFLATSSCPQENKRIEEITKKQDTSMNFILPLITNLILLSIPLGSYGKMNQQMNGITLEKYRGFEKTWELITVRYRKDSSELRLVYANKIASRAFKKGSRVFPDGSVLAKVAYLTQADPAFESSLAPAQNRRFQFMVKNKKLYKQHHGWGYALFDPQGNVHPGPVEEQTAACASCHEIVPERDYVFSWKFNQEASLAPQIFKLNFDRVPLDKSMERYRKLIPLSFDSVLKIKSPLTRNVFQGTLDELKPALAKLSVTNKSPVLFESSDGRMFTLIYPEDLTIECEDEGAKGLFVVSINSMPKGENHKVHFCQAR
jgi:hypothetical protein